jgi:predicted nucleic acid-binding protein
MSTVIYFDTSALAKWYINETKSEEVEQYIREQGPVSISDLTVVEMRCLLARRRREKSIDAKMETEIFATFQEDIREKFLICHQLPEGCAAGAVNLLSVLSDIPLRTLDALHLAIAKDLTVDILATADNIMASGGSAMGISVVKF